MVLRKGKHSGADRLNISIRNGCKLAPATPDVSSILPAASEIRTARPGCISVPLFNGAAGENAALAAILAGDLPVIEIINEVDGAVLDRGHPSAEIAAGLSGALETVMVRTLTMLSAILSGTPRIVPQLARPVTSRSTAGPPAALSRAASPSRSPRRSIASAAMRRIGISDGGQSKHWRLADRRSIRAKLECT